MLRNILQNSSSLRKVVQETFKVQVASLNSRLNPGAKESRQPSAFSSTESFEDYGFENTTVSDILEAKHKDDHGTLLYCKTDDSVYDAVSKMVSENIGALLVMDEVNHLAGIITERDYLRKMIVQGRSSKTTKVGDIMTEENKLITVTPETKVIQAMELMTDNRIRHVPIVNDKEMVGMLSIKDVVAAVVGDHRNEVKRLSDYIRGNYDL